VLDSRLNLSFVGGSKRLVLYLRMELEPGSGPGLESGQPGSGWTCSRETGTETPCGWEWGWVWDWEWDWEWGWVSASGWSPSLLGGHGTHQIKGGEKQFLQILRLQLWE